MCVVAVVSVDADVYFAGHIEILQGNRHHKQIRKTKVELVVRYHCESSSNTVCVATTVTATTNGNGYEKSMQSPRTTIN